MEKPIGVNDAGFKVTSAPASNSLTVTFETGDNESYTIEVDNRYATEENLYKFFKYIEDAARGNTTAYKHSSVAIENMHIWNK